MSRLRTAVSLGMVLLMGSGLPAHAGYEVTLRQEGGNVVATGSGAIDLTGLTPNGTDTADAFLTPDVATISTGSPNYLPIKLYSGFTGPSAFGSGGQASPSSGSGDTVGLYVAGPNLWVPSSYVSDGALADMSTYANTTLASLGATPGIYEWTWGTGADQNFTLDIIAPVTTAPEPGSLALLGSFAGGLAVFRRRRMAA